MGVHTGDSWTVAPQQTLPDAAYQRLREAAFATARAVGVATGGANVQFAVHPETHELRVIEMNPRVSRSSALASRRPASRSRSWRRCSPSATRSTSCRTTSRSKTTAAFEPALDYVAVKAPRFEFEKFPWAERTLGAEMRAIGEALGLGRTFPEAFVKALEGREAGPVAFDEHAARRAGARAVGPLPRGRPPWSRAAGHPSVLRGAAARGRRVSHADRAARAARRRLLRGRVRSAHAVLLRHARGCRRGAGALRPRRRRPRLRAEPDRPGDRVRLLLRPRSTHVEEARLRGGARELESRDRLDRLRHLRPAVSRAAHRSARARGVRARASVRGRRLVRRADAAASRACAGGGRRSAAR